MTRGQHCVRRSRVPGHVDVRWRWRLAAHVIACCALAVPTLALAQEARDTARTGTVLGRAYDAETGAPIAGVQASVIGTSRIAVTSREGEFRIGRIEAGEYDIELRMLGYETISQAVTVPPGGVARPRFEMRPAVVPLDELVVAGQPAAVSRQIGRAHV